MGKTPQKKAQSKPSTKIAASSSSSSDDDIDKGEFAGSGANARGNEKRGDAAAKGAQAFRLPPPPDGPASSRTGAMRRVGYPLGAPPAGPPPSPPAAATIPTLPPPLRPPAGHRPTSTQPSARPRTPPDLLCNWSGCDTSSRPPAPRSSPAPPPLDLLDISPPDIPSPTLRARAHPAPHHSTHTLHRACRPRARTYTRSR